MAMRVLLSSALVLLSSCAPRGGVLPGATEPPFEIPIRVTAGGETPLSGVAVRAGRADAMLTDASGGARLRVRGRTGDEVEVHVVCPVGYASPSAAMKVTLYRVVDGANPPARTVTCTPTSRKVVTVIRLDRSVTLPIVRFGHAIGGTDPSGVAHVLIEGKPGEHVDLTLDTSDVKGSALRPRSPTLSFVVPEHDDLVVLDQSFAIEPDKASTPRRAPSRRSTAAAAVAPASSLPTKI